MDLICLRLTKCGILCLSFPHRFILDNVSQELGVFIAQGSSRFEDIHRYTPYIEQNYVSGNGIKFCIELVSQPNITMLKQFVFKIVILISNIRHWYS